MSLEMSPNGLQLDFIHDQMKCAGSYSELLFPVPRNICSVQ